MKKVICGIQQVGIGVMNVYESWSWYRRFFGMNIRIFDEEAEAKLMLHYTQGVPRRRHAVLAINMQGGGGFEVWQHKGKTPEAPKTETSFGDLGIFATKLKTRDVQKAYAYFKNHKLNLINGISKDPVGKENFFVKDPYNNFFQIIHEDEALSNTKSMNGGVFGGIIGVSDIDRSMVLYSDILEYDNVVYDKTSNFHDFAGLEGGKDVFRRVLLSRSKPNKGGFSSLYGPTAIELVQVMGRVPTHIFKDRMWGDLGFIHMCFDVIGMDALRKECERKGFPFTVDSSKSFDMGDAAGHFSYVSDPDGTPIEFVETHKVPIIKKLGWYLNLKKRNPEKSLPKWMINTLKFNRVKE